jgi:hypothetical protein
MKPNKRKELSKQFETLRDGYLSTGNNRLLERALIIQKQLKAL